MGAKHKLFTADDFQAGPKVVTIAAIEHPTLKSGKATIGFRETASRIALTKKRMHLLQQLFGTDTRKALGRKIELFRARGLFKGALTPFVGVRPPTQAAKK